MNLFPLYRITDTNAQKKVERLLEKPEKISEELPFLKNLCSEETNNWLNKGKIKNCLGDKAQRLAKLCPDFPALQVLCSETASFADAQTLHTALRHAVFEMLNQGQKIPLALNILFFLGDKKKTAKEDRGKLSVAFNSKKIVDDFGISAISEKFVTKLNAHLLKGIPQSEEISDGSILDAFDSSFIPDEEKMPKIKLDGGFDVSLRTMFKDHQCQKRYGRIESGSYPLSPELRTKLAAALTWISSKDNEDKHWIKSDKNEILFAYPYIMPKVPVQFASLYKHPKPENDENSEASFDAASKQFLEEFKKGKDPDTDPKSDKIQLFILKKVDKARCKVLYSRQTDPKELETRCEDWTKGCAGNLPNFFSSNAEPLKVPFPLNIIEILNTPFQQNGTEIEKKGKTVAAYHGLELLLDPEVPIAEDLHNVAEKGWMLGPVLGNSRIKWKRSASSSEKKSSDNKKSSPFKKEKSITTFGLKDYRVRNLLVLMGLLLYRKNIKKENYMENIPYCYGQLLKVSDELHALYCRVVRKGNEGQDPYPPQFVGASLFQSAAEQPLKTLNMLRQRINPYIAWAKSYRLKEAEESWRAGWFLSLYEKLAPAFKDWTPVLRFTDEEKVQLFIGYLASLKQNQSDTQQNTETQNHE